MENENVNDDKNPFGYETYENGKLKVESEDVSGYNNPFGARW